MLNEMIVVKPTIFRGSDSGDKNGEPTIMLLVQAGKCPNRNTISGTVAKMNGFEVGKVYLATVRETGTDDAYGRQFTFERLQELDAMDTIKARKELGDPELITIPKPKGLNDGYKRKTNTVEGLNRERERLGLFKRSQGEFTDHRNANGIKMGSTVKDARPEDINLSSEDLKAAADKAEAEKVSAEENIDPKLRATKTEGTKIS